MTMTAPESAKLPDLIQAWLAQLLDPAFVDFVSRVDDHQIDVKLSGSHGRVRRRPAISIDEGMKEMVEPAALLNALEGRKPAEG